MKEALDNLKGLEARRTAHMQDLDRSLALRLLWPEVFAQGKATSHIVTCLAPSPSRQEILARLVVTDGAGNTRTFEQDAVPKILREGF